MMVLPARMDGEAVDALADTRDFIGSAEVNLVGFSVPAYFAYIGLMGES